MEDLEPCPGAAWAMNRHGPESLDGVTLACSAPLGSSRIAPRESDVPRAGATPPTPAASTPAGDLAHPRGGASPRHPPPPNSPTYQGAVFHMDNTGSRSITSRPHHGAGPTYITSWLPRCRRAVPPAWQGGRADVYWPSLAWRRLALTTAPPPSPRECTPPPSAPRAHAPSLPTPALSHAPPVPPSCRFSTGASRRRLGGALTPLPPLVIPMPLSKPQRA